MTCWKCGAQTVDNTCTMCGCLQDTRLPAETPNGKSLRYIYDKLGPAATLANPTNFIRSLSDVFPDDEELRRHMKLVLQTNVGAHLFVLLSDNKDIDEVAQRELMHVVRSKCALSDAEIRQVLDLLLEMVGCGKESPNAKIPAINQSSIKEIAAEKQTESARSSVQMESASEQPKTKFGNDDRFIVFLCVLLVISIVLAICMGDL